MKHETTINLTQNQRMDDYFQTALKNDDLFLFIENLVIDMP